MYWFVLCWFGLCCGVVVEGEIKGAEGGAVLQVNKGLPGPYTGVKVIL